MAKLGLYLTISFALFMSVIAEHQNLTAGYSDRRTASAVIYDDDGVWGSVVFHQSTNDAPVIIGLLFQNINGQGGGPIHYAIHDEPLHYDMYSKSDLCKPTSLRHIIKADNDEMIGDLSHRHNAPMYHDKARFSFITSDNKLSLFEGSPGFILNKSFVIKQGTSEDHHRCATIEISELERQRAGAIPCEVATYADCLVGAAESDNTCVFRACLGFRRRWNDQPINRNTLMCKQITERYPKPNQPIAERSGVIPCQYGSHTLLDPIPSDTEL